MNWLEDLLDEYPTGRSDRAIQRLRNSFASEPHTVMEAAVIVYMRENKFFPKISDLNDYVERARIDNNTWGARWSELLEAAKKTGDYSRVDDIILEWEVGRGEMPVNAGERNYWDVVTTDLVETLEGVPA